MMNVQKPTPPAAQRRPRFQFSLLGLFVLMFVGGAAAAPGYYLLRGQGELPQGRLVGMLMMLAGPLLAMTLLSIFLSFFANNDSE
jgi:hypothetical protein